MNNNKNYPTIELGRYRIAPMALRRDDGGFDASVSIRSGQGMASVDRVMRFTAPFNSAHAALRHARTQGLAWARCH